MPEMARRLIGKYLANPQLFCATKRISIIWYSQVRPTFPNTGVQAVEKTVLPSAISFLVVEPKMFERHITGKDAQTNRLVYDLSGLTAEEFKIAERR